MYSSSNLLENIAILCGKLKPSPKVNGKWIWNTLIYTCNVTKFDEKTGYRVFLQESIKLC